MDTESLIENSSMDTIRDNIYMETKLDYIHGDDEIDGAYIHVYA